MKFTKIPTNAFETLQMNAGVIAKKFDPVKGALTDSDILGATSGGISFSAVPTFKDLGEDIDNCPKNTKELKKLESWEITMSGSFVSASKESLKTLLAAADSSDHLTLRNDIQSTDFLTELWLVADYGSEDGAYIAVKLINALSTGGLVLQTTDKEKGKFNFTFTAHYSIAEQDTVPCEIYVSETAPIGA